MNVIVLLVFITSMGYLVYAIVHPEKF
ncbi:potassium-transporting ATPase subunit F [Chlorobium limicola]|nr:potassium-transporting ATPase subunit F [Chlorobiaceae bacterium]